MLQDLIDQIFLIHRRPPAATPPATREMADSKDPTSCPVDHKSREVWLQQARAQAQAQSEPSLPPQHPPVPGDADAASCPVDHKAREVWLQSAQSSDQINRDAQAPPNTQPKAPTPTSSWSSTILSYLPFQSSGTHASAPTTTTTSHPVDSNLGTDRVISTIPRSQQPLAEASSSSSTSPTTPSSHEPPRPANTEVETGADPTSGNWIYPSEKMFFEAMKRKGHEAQARDMQVVVPIHNAVNERAWAEIKQWEAPWVKGSTCEGPRLRSFSGLSTNLSPRARFNTLLGYQAPFDRHDWVVDRCGKEVEYVIDFYSGRASGPNDKLSFYLDVRPKLNTWEGVKMRVARGLGVV